MSDNKPKLNHVELQEIKSALLKSGAQRSYDELLMLKSFLTTTDFVKHNIGNALFPKQMDELCRSIVLESFHQGDTIIKQGDVGDRMYIVLDGVCEVRLKQNVELAHGLSEVREKALFQCNLKMHFGEKALQTDEPRGASVVAVAYSDLISIHKFTYSNLIKSAIAEAEANASLHDMPGTKGYTLKILSKKPEFRTKLEIEAVAGYLDWRIPFFRKFTPDQRLELSRVSQAVSIYGETVLFKQGSVGQAFYVVLTGSVEVWVASADEVAMNQALMYSQLAHTTGTAASKGATADDNLKHGLGTKVAMLAVGDTFGERALENEDSTRMASICTCESLTDMLVIAREDYHKLVSALTNQELMKKIKILRSTDLFRNIDAVYLKELARYMEPKRFELDEVLFSAGSRATEMIITDIGECIVEVPISTFTTAGNAATKTKTDDDSASEVNSIMVGEYKKKSQMEVGRIAPHSVLGAYITQVVNLYEHIIHPETVTASTLVVGYTVGLHDFYSNMNREAKTKIVELVKEYEGSALPILWETQARRVGDLEWRTKMAWDKYRSALRVPGCSLTYSDVLKTFSNIHLTVDSGNMFQNKSGAYKPRPEDLPAFYPTNFQKIAALTTREHRDDDDLDDPESQTDSSGGPMAHSSIVYTKPVDKNWGLPQEKRTAKSLHLKDLDYDLEAIHPVVKKALQATAERDKQRAIDNAIQAELNSNSKHGGGKKNTTADDSASTGSDNSQNLRRPTKTSNEATSLSDDPQRFPFSLVHIHQEKVPMNANSLGAQRKLKCYMRLCGTLETCSSTKKAAEMQMESVLLMQYNSDLSKRGMLQLHWHSFSSFEGMPLHNSDIFLVFCRSVPVEFACIRPEKDLMAFEFPAFCKQKNQFYSVTLMRGLSPPEVPLPDLTEKRLRRRRKPRKADLYGIEYDDTDDEGSDDEQVKIEREYAITAAGLPASHAYKESKFKLQLTQPVFLQELGSFAEHLCTSTTLKGCLLYGKFAQSQMAAIDNIATTYDPEMAEQAMTASGIGLKGGFTVGGSRPSSRVSTAASAMEAAAKAAAGKMTADDKRICVFPLYVWLPISEEVLKEHDITNLCNRPAPEHEIRLVGPGPGMGATAGPTSTLLRTASSSSGFGLGALDSIDTVMGLGNKDPDDPKKSFTEAGMLSPFSKNKDNKNSMSLSELPFLQDVVKQVSVKGLNKTVNLHFQHELAEQKIKKEEARLEARRKQLWEMRPENRESARPRVKGEDKEDTMAREEKDVSAADMSFIETKEKVESLSRVLADRRRMIALNDKLCKDEGKLKPRKGRKAVPAVPLADDAELSPDEDESAGAVPRLLSFQANKALQTSQSMSALEGPYQAPGVSVGAFLRGVTLASTQMSGDLGPGGMGLLRQRMNMYDSLSGLPSSRKAVESVLVKKKRDEEEEKARKLRNAPIPLKEAVVYSADSPVKDRETILPQTLSVLRGIMDRTHQF